MVTRKKHQLDINLSNVKDPAVREALNSIISQVNDLSQNVSVSTDLRAKKLATHTGIFSVDEGGMVRCSSLNTDSGGAVKMKVFSGSLSPSSGTNLELSGNHKIVGAIGWASINGGTSETHMELNSASSTTPYFSYVNNDKNTLRVYNFNASDTNYYRVIVFYVEN